MKIAIFTDTYKPLVNGVTYSIDMYALLLKKLGHDVTIYSPSYENTELGTELSVKTFYSIGIPSYKEMRIVFPNLISIIRSIHENNPDIIHIHSPGGLGLTGILISKIFKKPLVCTFHNHPRAFTHYLPLSGITTKTGHPISEESIWKLFLYIYKSCDLIICPTNYMKEQLKKRSRSKKIRLEVLSNGIDTQAFYPATQVPLGQNILFVGRLALEKNIALLISAFKIVVTKLPDAKLNIVGGGPILDSLKELVIEMDLQNSVCFHGEIPREDLPEIYRENNIFVLPSENEVQPLVIMEAFSCGLPVIGMSKSGISETVTNNFDGLLVDKSDVIEMSKSILELLEDRMKLLKFSENAKKSANGYDINLLGNRLINLYQSLIK